MIGDRFTERIKENALATAKRSEIALPEASSSAPPARPDVYEFHDDLCYGLRPPFMKLFLLADIVNGE